MAKSFSKLRDYCVLEMSLVVSVVFSAYLYSSYSIKNERLQEDNRILKQNNAVLQLPKQIEESKFLLRTHMGSKIHSFFINYSTYHKYREQIHSIDGVFDYAKFVTYEDKDIKKIATKITKGAKTPEEKARRIEKFVHRNVVYDNSVEKYFDHVKFPIETLIEKNGDCEDMAILETALLKAAGLDAVLITFPRGLREEDIAHVGVGIDGNFTGYSFPDKGKNYYFDEPTGVNSPIGKIDPIYKKSLFQIVKPK
jgi:hypothetical protein